MAATLFLSSRPAHQRSATDRGAERADQWNLSEAVWPPPQVDVASPLPPRASSRAAKRAYEASLNQQQSNPPPSKPFNSYSLPSRSGRTSRRDENGRSSTRVHQPIVFSSPNQIAVPTNVRSRTVYSPTNMDRRSEVSRAGFGDKDYPAGYAPTPRPTFQEISPSQPYTYAAKGAAREERQLKPLIPPPSSYPHPAAKAAGPVEAIGFFEPLVTPADVPIHVRSPPLTYSSPEQPFTSPVLENGRPVQMCRVPSELPPGGVIERGWREGYAMSPEYLNTNTRRSNSNSRSRSSGNHRLTPHSHEAHPSPLAFSPTPIYEAGATRGGFSVPAPAPGPTPIAHFGPPPPALNLSPRSDGPTPTRKGYWNQRGDTIGRDGFIRPAPHTQMFPPDLERYPKFAFMNEFGKLTIPATGDERVMLWRSYDD